MERILFLSAHPDDFEAGAGGFFTKARDSGKECFSFVFSECSEQKGNEGIVQEFHESMKTLGIGKGSFELMNLPNTKLPENSARIREAMERLRDEFKPDTVLVHDPENLHQDHRCVAEQTLRVFKTHSILFYQDMKSTPHFMPNMFSQLTNEQLERKIKALECYKTQLRRYYHDMEFVRAIARVHGKRINAEFAEGFRAYQYRI
jgi:LmbE family N-acetylglucosaminyl deacetylase